MGVVGASPDKGDRMEFTLDPACDFCELAILTAASIKRRAEQHLPQLSTSIIGKKHSGIPFNSKTKSENWNKKLKSAIRENPR